MPGEIGKHNRNLLGPGFRKLAAFATLSPAVLLGLTACDADKSKPGQDSSPGKSHIDLNKEKALARHPEIKITSPELRLKRSNEFDKLFNPKSFSLSPEEQLGYDNFIKDFDDRAIQKANLDKNAGPYISYMAAQLRADGAFSKFSEGLKKFYKPLLVKLLNDGTLKGELKDLHLVSDPLYRPLYQGLIDECTKTIKSSEEGDLDTRPPYRNAQSVFVFNSKETAKSAAEKMEAIDLTSASSPTKESVKILKNSKAEVHIVTSPDRYESHSESVVVSKGAEGTKNKVQVLSH